jgi:hypothetical protein
MDNNSRLDERMKIVLTYNENPENEFDMLQNEIALENLQIIKKIYKEYDIELIREKIKSFLMEIKLNNNKYVLK